MNFKELLQMADNIYSMYERATNSSLQQIKFALMMTELFQKLRKHQQAADYFVKVAQAINSEKAIIISLFYEQAAYEYLKMQSFRKFSFYMYQAGQHYQKQ
mmetsp:Transcript_26089/g.35613  ORF Transcript_26089/g.35613 Transcript_26089/m.35613 type:complete len:101 (+) Transcript_26089:1316-1618(+)